MLSSREIEDAKSVGLLIPVTARDEWTNKGRAFLMCKPLHDALGQGRSSPDDSVRKRWAQLEAAMIHFVENGRMDEKLIKQLVPPKFEHWELISRRPRPSLRVFGRFALPDVFIGTHVKERKELGGKWSDQFEMEKLICEQHYKRAGLTCVFSDNPLFRYNSYITENASAQPRIPR